MTIKHLVISGGGPIMIQTLGAIQHLTENDFFHVEEIESIYGTSAGAIVAVLLCLKFDWETINDYIIKRPWHEVFPIKVQNILDAYTKKGIFDIKTVEKCFKPLFDAKDISLNITLREFYEYSKIELHIFTFDINAFKTEDISYLTHPDLKLLTVIQMTSSLPILMEPVCNDGKCYIDGGMSCNYPMEYCVNAKKDENEILGFKNVYQKKEDNITQENNMLDFLLSFLFKVLRSLNTDDKQPKIKNEVLCNADFLSMDVLSTALKSMDVRRQLHNAGKEAASQFLKNYNNNHALIEEAKREID